MRTKCKRTRAALVLALLLLLDEDDDLPVLTDDIESLVYDPSFGCGRGRNRRRKTCYQDPVPVYSRLIQAQRLLLFETLVRMKLEDFDCLFKEIYRRENFKRAAALSPRTLPVDQLLLTLIWVFHYPTYSNLSLQFGLSSPKVAFIIEKILLELAEYFRDYVPNSLGEEPMTSSLSNQIVAVVDGTIHKVSKPGAFQSRMWNGHYKRHGMMTHLLVTMDGKIAAFVTNIPGVVHDALVATYNDCFRRVLGKQFAVADTGYSGISNVVAGLKGPLDTYGKRAFDRISRKEQAIVENVNCWLKKAVTLDKSTNFRHGNEKLYLCVFICCGLHNWKIAQAHITL